MAELEAEIEAHSAASPDHAASVAGA